MKKITFLVLLFFPLFILSQSNSLTADATWGPGNCGNPHTQTITINGDLNLNGHNLTLQNVNLIVNGNLNGGGKILNSCKSTICVKGSIQNNPTINVPQNMDCTIPPCTKTWNGSVSTDWNVANNWTPSGVPTLLCDVTIGTATNPCIVTSRDAVAKTVTVTNSASLQVDNNAILKVKGLVNVASTASFIIEDSGSLVQVDDVANIGSISKKRSTNITKFDYVYWSSPVASFNVSHISPSSSLIYKWVPTIATNLNGFGNWAGAANNTMELGKGYIVRGPNHFSTNTPQVFNTTFTGVPNNGTISTPISRGTYDGDFYYNGSNKVTKDDDNWNLLGNPYPSAISVAKFLDANPNIEGFVDVWTHATSIGAGNGNPFYGSFVYNYSSNDYLKMNGTGTLPKGFEKVIGSGQGFMVKMLHDTPSTTESVVFNNEMREITLPNSQFFRTQNVAESTVADEANRIWINMVAPNGVATGTLIGYVTDATDGIDRVFDAETQLKANFELFSIIDNRYFNIQGKGLPFTKNDEIPLGYSTNQSGIHTFGLDAVDGLFEDNQAIYIEDLELGIIHDLKAAPYTFTTATGTFSNRFVLRFSNETLSAPTVEKNNELQIYTSNGIIASANTLIQAVLVYDIQGRLLYQNQAVNQTEFQITNVSKSNSPLVIQVVFENQVTVSKKVIY